MATHGREDGQRVGVGEQDLESMSSHDNQVEEPVRLVALRRGLDPLHLFRVRFASGHGQHRRRWINPRRPVTTFGKSTAERACTATQVEDTTWTRSGEGKVEVGILRPRVNEVVNLGNLWIVVIHASVTLPPRLPRLILQLWREGENALRNGHKATMQSRTCAIDSAR